MQSAELILQPTATPTLPIETPRRILVRQENSLPLPWAAGVATTAAIVGIFSIFSTAFALYSLWTSDPLKSIGGLVPIASLFLILRAWRALGWKINGTWWGLAI